MLCAHFLQAVKFHIVLRKNFFSCVTKVCKVIRIHRIHHCVDALLCCLVGFYILGYRNQLISAQIPASVRILRHRKRAKISSVFTAGYNIGIPVLNWFSQLRVCMATDDQIKIRNRLGKEFVLRLAFIFPGSTMRNTGDHVCFFVFLDFFYCFLNGPNRIFER